ncbi:BofC-like protein [Herbinix hemicellulosilytica]|uniref:Putative secreted protein n=1 Tax=Herbinix hemicellulosilytica TaxID=1564487 RepID=A0A0H5SVC5_HERHM|nr:BofC C-terminal domain-containing protein [Herbinix hemicellulosilytica]RBP60591.1 BofC-like protein [Herbinix hemicellulosilytica]CRZ34278.1 putative secreted protein [Herbinix hemicellulosilytica]
MKLRKAYIFVLSFLSLSLLFSVCYYLSYQHALRQFNKRAVERSEEFAALHDNITPAPAENSPAVEDTENNNDNIDSDETVAVDVQPEPIILPTTKFILEIYDRKKGTLEQIEQNPPGDFVGLTREEVEKYLDDYMKDLTLSEYNKGLLSYELISFSDKAVKLRKSYDADMVPYRFYVVVKNGYVVVYNSDLKSVYEYTHIEAKNLPEEDRTALSQGIYVDNIDDLYALLESFTS